MKQTYIIALAIIIAASLAAFIFSSNSNSDTAATTNQESTTVASSTEPTTADSSSSSFTLEDVAAHSTENDCWMAIDGKVYDVSAYFGRHPGGNRELLRGCGIDATEAFNTQGGEGSHSSFAVGQLAEFEIGTLE